MPELTVRRLGESELELAWPLLRGRSGETSPGGWRRFAERLLRRGGGVVGIAAEDGLLHGIATFEPVTRARSGRVLQVDNLVTFELSRKAPVRNALCAALADFARALQCEAVSVAHPNRGFVANAAWRAGLANPEG